MNDYAGRLLFELLESMPDRHLSAEGTSRLLLWDRFETGDVWHE
jgi:hypothetical protein